MTCLQIKWNRHDSYHFSKDQIPDYVIEDLLTWNIKSVMIFVVNDFNSLTYERLLKLCMQFKAYFKV